jgi:DNA-binding SARP family transcriptional activator
MTLVGHGVDIDESDLPGIQGRLVVAMLLLERRPVPRDQLVEWLWTAEPGRDADKLLTALLSKVRTQLARLGDPDVELRSLSGSYELSVPADAWIDVEEAIMRLDRAEGAIRRGDSRVAWPDATVAVSILRRGMLSGCSGEWVEQRRRELDRGAFRAWVVLATVWLAQGDSIQAATAARAAINADRFREDGYRLLVDAELLGGNRATAAHAARECERMLEDELGVGPSEMTRKVFERIGG